MRGVGTPMPSPGQGHGETRVPHPPTAVGGAWCPTGRDMGKPGFPVCSPQSFITLPSGRGLGKPGFPISQPPLGAAGAPQAGVRFDRLTAGGETRFPRMFTSVVHYSPLREGVGETRFPHVPTAVGSGWLPHRQGDGETRFPRMFTSARAADSRGAPLTPASSGLPPHRPPPGGRR